MIEAILVVAVVILTVSNVLMNIRLDIHSKMFKEQLALNEIFVDLIHEKALKNQ